MNLNTCFVADHHNNFNFLLCIFDQNKYLSQQTAKSFGFDHPPLAAKSVMHMQDKKGRPKKDAEPDRISWKITGELLEDLEAIQKVKNSVGKFILATNMPDEQLSNESALTNYKAQGYSVERGFRFLKDPMFFAESMYLKKPSRIMGLMMVMTLSLLVYSLAERELREKLQSENESLPDQKGKPGILRLCGLCRCSCICCGNRTYFQN